MTAVTVGAPAGPVVGRARAGVRHAFQVAGAFLWMGWLQTSAYPLSFVMQQVSSLMPAFIYHFIGRLVSDTALVGGDYYTFAMIGLLGLRILAGGLNGVGEALDAAIAQGQFEALLVQPVHWRLLPLGLVQWPIVWRLVNLVVMAAVTIPLGAHYSLGGLPLAIVVMALGVVATMSVGILAASIKVLAKRTEPVITFYVIAVNIFGGVFYPVQKLPHAMQWVSHLIPDFYVISTMRHLLMPGYHVAGTSTPVVIAGLIIFDVVMLPLALMLFGRSLDYGRRLGMLGGY